MTLLVDCNYSVIFRSLSLRPACVVNSVYWQFTCVQFFLKFIDILFIFNSTFWKVHFLLESWFSIQPTPSSKFCHRWGRVQLCWAVHDASEGRLVHEHLHYHYWHLSHFCYICLFANLFSYHRYSLEQGLWTCIVNCEWELVIWLSCMCVHETTSWNNLRIHEHNSFTNV